MLHYLLPIKILYYKHTAIINETLESSLSDITIWNVTIVLLITVLEVSFTLNFDVYSTVVTFDDRQLTI